MLFHWQPKKKSESSVRNSTKPEVFVFFSKGQGLGSQPEVKIDTCSLHLESVSRQKYLLKNIQKHFDKLQNFIFKNECFR